MNSMPFSAVGSGPAIFHPPFARETTAERFAAGRAVVWEGDPARHVFQLVEGTVRHCRILVDGRRIIAGFGYPGDLFGFFEAARYLFTSEAVTQCRARRMSLECCERSAGSGTRQQAELARRLRLQHGAMYEDVLMMLHRNADQRVAGFMLNAGRQPRSALRNGDSFALAMPRNDIADHLGLTVETVSRAISRLRRDGIVALKGKNTVVVLDLARLRSRADENAARLRIDTAMNGVDLHAPRQAAGALS